MLVFSSQSIRPVSDAGWHEYFPELWKNLNKKRTWWIHLPGPVSCSDFQVVVYWNDLFLASEICRYNTLKHVKIDFLDFFPRVSSCIVCAWTNTRILQLRMCLGALKSLTEFCQADPGLRWVPHHRKNFLGEKCAFGLWLPSCKLFLIKSLKFSALKCKGKF